MQGVRPLREGSVPALVQTHGDAEAEGGGAAVQRGRRGQVDVRRPGGTRQSVHQPGRGRSRWFFCLVFESGKSLINFN